MRGKTKKLLCAAFAVICVLLLAAGAADASVGEAVSVFEGDVLYEPAFTHYEYGLSGVSDEKTATVKVLGIPIKNVSVSVFKKTEVIPGGQSFGVRLQTRGVTVVGTGAVILANKTAEPATDAGLKENDVIISANGEEILSSRQFTEILQRNGAQGIKIIYKRGGVEYETTLYPVKDENGEYKAGMWLKDTAAGIGTVTYIVPEDNSFAGLGHGICEADSKELLPFNSGEVFVSHITGVKRGKNGEPGELRGYFEKEPAGTLTANTQSGVYGKLDKCEKGKTVQIALKDKVKTGNVKILCTVDDGGVCEYDAKIIKILSYSTKEKNFIVKITDEELIRKTGGIVQGMSGSPILQDGKLIGAVTHVLVNDASRGYGIFIENMLENN
ncbi:MAG: SpoIVB peptidase [Clostridia bacterium]|nr:SpoIVB peptidase [Clostridia bacterium]